MKCMMMSSCTNWKTKPAATRIIHGRLNSKCTVLCYLRLFFCQTMPDNHLQLLYISLYTQLFCDMYCHPSFDMLAELTLTDSWQQAHDHCSSSFVLEVSDIVLSAEKSVLFLILHDSCSVKLWQTVIASYSVVDRCSVILSLIELSFRLILLMMAMMWMDNTSYNCNLIALFMFRVLPANNLMPSHKTAVDSKRKCFVASKSLERMWIHYLTSFLEKTTKQEFK